MTEILSVMPLINYVKTGRTTIFMRLDKMRDDKKRIIL